MQHLFGKNGFIYSFFLVYLLTCFTVTKAGSHTLMAFATYIDGQTPFPEFSVVLMLDDVQIGYYDSVTWSVTRHSPSDSKYQNEEKSDADIVFLELYNIMKDRAVYNKELLNNTN
ncbi:hypothetical protein QQF64_034445, partial [Cirrhinus molitorella]